MLLSVHVFLFPTVSKKSSTVSWFNLSLRLDSKVVNVLNTLSVALLDDKSKILSNSFWWFLNSQDQISVSLKSAYCVFPKILRAFHSAKCFNLLSLALASGSWNSLIRIPISSWTFFVWPSSQYCTSIHFIAWETLFSTREENLSLMSVAITAITSDWRSKAFWRLFMVKETSSISTSTYSQLLTFFCLCLDLGYYDNSVTSSSSSLGVNLRRKLVSASFSSSLAISSSVSRACYTAVLMSWAIRIFFLKTNYRGEIL